MSTSTDGILAYGYDLGGDEGEWLIQEIDEYGQPALLWFDPEADDADFVEAAKDALMTAHGFTGEWVRGADNSAYFAAKNAAEKAIGVKFDTYCSGDYPMYLMAAKVITVSRGSVIEIDWAALTQERVENQWDDKLAAALLVLGLTPRQAAPKWLLASYWG
jgi:hypothetical protein